MSESATWKAVSTLEWKKKQKAPAEPKGFGAILGEAADVVVDKWNATGNLVPTYLKRLTEIQIQDESYIHQQLVKPEEVKIRRGLNRMISLGKSKAGKGIRLLKANGSRKVRFGDETHSKPAAGSIKNGYAGSGSSASNSSPFAASTISTSPASKSSNYNKGATVGAGRLKSGIRFAVAKDAAPTDHETNANAVCNSISASAVAAANNAPPEGASGSLTAATACVNSGSSNPASKGSSRTQSPAASAHQQQQLAPAQNKQSSSSGGQLQQQLSSGSEYGIALKSNRNSTSGTDASLSMMCAFLQQQVMQQPSETPSCATGNLSGNWAGSCSGNWEETPSKTELVDKQLQRLRMAASTSQQQQQQQPQQQQGPESPGYRPLAISEELFDRWSSAAGGGSSASTTATIAALSALHTSVDFPGTGGTVGSRASRRSSHSNIANGYGDSAQAGTTPIARSSSKDLSKHLPSSRSAPDFEAMATAAGGGGGSISGQHSARSVGDAPVGCKQRHSSDYMTTLGGTEASLHPGRRTGSCGSVSTTQGAGSPQQLPSSPCGGHSSSSSITASWLVSGGSGTGAAAKPQRSTSTALRDVGQLDMHHAPSSSKPLAANGRSSRPSSNPRGNRSIDLQNSPTAGVAVSGNSARAKQGRVGSPPTPGGNSSNGGSSSSSGDSYTHHRLSGPTTAAGDNAARSTSGGSVHLPDIGRHAAKQPPQIQLTGLAGCRK